MGYFRLIHLVLGYSILVNKVLAFLVKPVPLPSRTVALDVRSLIPHETSPSPAHRHYSLFNTRSSRTSVTCFVQKRSKPAGLDENVRSKLVAESIAPWRLVRLFFYGALGSGAAIGGLVTLPAVLAVASGVRNDLDLNTEVRK